MKKLAKTLVALSLILVLNATHVSHAHADDKPLLRYSVCQTCKTGKIVPSNSYTGWMRTGTQKRCEHHAYGSDIEETRTKSTVYRCNQCNTQSGPVRNTTETRWVCAGVD